VFKVDLLVEEGVASNSKCVLLLFSRFLCDSLSHSLPPPCVCGFGPLCDYRLAPHYGPRPLSPLVLSFISPLFFHWATSPSRGPSSATADTNKNFGDVTRIPARWPADWTLKHLSNSILKPHHIDALLLLCNPITIALAFFFSCSVLLYSESSISSSCYRLAHVKCLAE
jgi:hypothetical protein